MNYDLVLHLDSEEEKTLRMCLRNALNYLNALPKEKFGLCLVANGRGPEQFVRHNPELMQIASDLSGRGLKIYVCANAMAEHNLKAEDLWPVCEIVPAGLVAIVELQKRGYSYVKP